MPEDTGTRRYTCANCNAQYCEPCYQDLVNGEADRD